MKRNFFLRIKKCFLFVSWRVHSRYCHHKSRLIMALARQYVSNTRDVFVYWIWSINCTGRATTPSFYEHVWDLRHGRYCARVAPMICGSRAGFHPGTLPRAEINRRSGADCGRTSNNRCPTVFTRKGLPRTAWPSFAMSRVEIRRTGGGERVIFLEGYVRRLGEQMEK